jgi:hypothetical protein
MSTVFKKIESQILAKSALFAQQGAIFATWRKHGNTRLGPYFKLKYFENGRRRSIYLGRSEEIVQQVRRLLAKIQSRRISRRLQNKIRKSLRAQKRILEAHLLANGYRMKGYEIHKPRIPKT